MLKTIVKIVDVCAGVYFLCIVGKAIYELGKSHKDDICENEELHNDIPKNGFCVIDGKMYKEVEK